MATKTLTLSEFLLARIDEDEAPAKWAQSVIHMQQTGDLGPLHPHIVESLPKNPTRVLAECEAKRRIVEMHGDNDADAACQSYAGNWVYEPCPTLRALALPYADHPDYDEAWRP